MLASEMLVRGLKLDREPLRWQTPALLGLAYRSPWYA